MFGCKEPFHIFGIEKQKLSFRKQNLYRFPQPEKRCRFPICFYEKTEIRTKSVTYSCVNGVCPVVCPKG